MTAAGIAFALLAASALSTTVILLRVATDAGWSADALVVLLSNITILIPLAIAFQDPIAELGAIAVGSFALAGVIGTLLGRAFYYASIERVGTSRSEPIKASQPIYATIVAIVISARR